MREILQRKSNLLCIQGKCRASTCVQQLLMVTKKDPTDSTHLIIDEEVAPVVRYIYDLAEEGLGLHCICKRLHDEKNP